MLSKSLPAACLSIALFIVTGCGSASSGSGSTGSTGSSGTATLSLTATSLTFPTTTVGQSSATQMLTLTNTGNATLTLSSYPIGDTKDFTGTTTCGASLAAGASCSFTIAFTPQFATLLTTTLTLTDNATNSPQTVTLSGTGTTSSTSTVTYTLYTFPETDNSVTPLYALINGAQKTIDMTMYALEDTTFLPVYNQLNTAGTNCSAVFSNTAFQATHQKSFIIDGTQVSIMSLNLQSQYYSTTRDFAMLTNDAADIAAIQATFNADYAAGTPSSGIAGTSDFSYAPAAGDNLIWSPTTAQAAMLAIISNAKSTLLVENEEMGAANIVSALVTACQNGVVVHIAMVSQSSYATQFKTLEAAGCGVHVYPNTTNGFYVHAKAVVADYGLTTQNVYMGSINYSNASMTQNRELGLYITDVASVQSLNTTMSADYAGGTAY